jgi:hypothetical protein
VLVRTGNMRLLRAGDKPGFAGNTPGLGVGSVEWLHDHEVAGIAPTRSRSKCGRPRIGRDLPVHMLNLRDQGLVQGQLWALDAPRRRLRGRRRLRVPARGDAAAAYRRVRWSGRPNRDEMTATK